MATPEELYTAVQQLKLYNQQNFPFKHTYYEGTVDPRAGAGLLAPVGALYAQKSGTDLVATYIKQTTADTGWEVFGAGGTGSGVSLWTPNTVYDSFATSGIPTLVWDTLSAKIYYNTADFTSAASFAADQLLARWLELGAGGGGAQLLLWDIEASSSLPVEATASSLLEIQGVGVYTNLDSSLVRFEDGDVAQVLLDGTTVVNLTKNNFAGSEVASPTWDPDQKSPEITLSNGNLTVTATGEGVVSTQVTVTGQKQYEVTAGGTALFGGFVAVETVTDTVDLLSTSPCAALTYISGATANMYVFVNGVNTVYTFTNAPGVYNVGDVLSLYYDSTTRIVQARLNGTLLLTASPIILPAVDVKPFYYGVNTTTTTNFGATPFAYPEAGYTALTASTNNFRGELRIVSSTWNPSLGYPTTPTPIAGDMHYAKAAGVAGGKTYRVGSAAWFDGFIWRPLDEYEDTLNTMSYLGDYPPLTQSLPNGMPTVVENGVQRLTEAVLWRDGNQASWLMWRHAAKDSLMIGKNGIWQPLVTSAVYDDNNYKWGTQPIIEPVPTAQNAPFFPRTPGEVLLGMFEFTITGDDLGTNFEIGIYQHSSADGSILYEPKGNEGPDAYTYWWDVQTSATTLYRRSGGVTTQIYTFANPLVLGDVFSFYLQAQVSGSITGNASRNNLPVDTFRSLGSIPGYANGFTAFAMRDGVRTSLESLVELNTGRLPFKYIPPNDFVNSTKATYNSRIIPLLDITADTSANVTSTYTALRSDVLVKADLATGPYSVTLPQYPRHLQIVRIQKVDASANVYTILGYGRLINGVTSLVGSPSQWSSYSLQYDSTTDSWSTI